ncbi:MAG: cation:proton antiporter domain-containing protein [Algiphilus sp.]
MDPVIIGVAFIGGFIAHVLRMPPLLGFLAAGFALNLFGFEPSEAIAKLADIGVTLLLFTIGLKLNIRTLLDRTVWGSATLHMALSTSAIAVFIVVASKLVALPLLSQVEGMQVLLLAFALSFSSTVFVVKALEDRSESNSFYGRVAIGVLIMQDIFAVGFMAASSGQAPSPWALLLLLLIPAAPLLQKLMERAGHGEVQVLFGVTFALVVGYGLFEFLGIKGDFGALIAGMLLAPHASSGALARALFNLKDLFLICFFVNLGLQAMPTWEAVGIAALLLIALLIKSAVYLFTFVLFRMRARSSVLATLGLSNFSEFGLIVAAVATSQGLLGTEWLTVLSLAVAASFVLSSPLNKGGEVLYRRFGRLLTRFESKHLHVKDRPIDLGDAEVVILGMGRIGRGAYDRFANAFGRSVLGVDNMTKRVRELQQSGFHVIEGDAADSDFWDKLLVSPTVDLVVLAMPHHAGNLFAIEQLRDRDFSGHIAAVVNYEDEIQPLRDRGADSVFHVYSEAGAGLADHAAEEIGFANQRMA